MDSCSQTVRSSFISVVFFFARPRAGRGEGVGAWGTETEGRGIGLGLAIVGDEVVAGPGELDPGDGGVEEEEEEAPAFCCSFASLFKRI